MGRDDHCEILIFTALSWDETGSTPDAPLGKPNRELFDVSGTILISTE